MTSQVAIIDYGLCNLDSVARATQECGASPVVTSDPRTLGSADRLILPGVGSFADAMSELDRRGLSEAIREEVAAGAPLLGICLGMQLLASAGEEGGESPGLGIIEGRVTRLQPEIPDERVPHVGWNEVHAQNDSALFREIPKAADFYFVHSYHFVPANDADVLARTPYTGEFVSAVGRDHVYAVQFHPEKSQANGLRLLANFIEL